MRTMVLAAGVLLSLATACGGGEGTLDLAAASERTQATGSSAFSLRVSQGGGGPAQRCEGVADYVAKRMRLLCDDDWELVAIGDTYFVRGEAPVFGIPPGTPWVRAPIGQGAESPHDFAPGALLAKLRAATTAASRIDEEEVRGVSTVRYRMTVRCDEADLECSTETTTVEIWIDEDGLVRRVSLEDGGLAITGEFHDFGIDVQVEAPPGDQVADIEEPKRGMCPGGGSPISTARVVRAFQAQGLKAESGGECLQGVAGQVIAYTSTGGDVGGMVCFVFAEAGRSAPATVTARSTPSVRSLALQNVTCSHLAGIVPMPGLEARARAAFAELERERRP